MQPSDNPTIKLEWTDGSANGKAKSFAFPLEHRSIGMDEAYCGVRSNDALIATILIQEFEDPRAKTFLLINGGVAVICFRGRVLFFLDDKVDDIREIKLHGVVLDPILWRQYIVLIGRHELAVLNSASVILEKHGIAYLDSGGLQGDKLILKGENKRAEIISKEYDLIKLISPDLPPDFRTSD